MTVYYAAKRGDGVLASVQSSPRTPSVASMSANAERQVGLGTWVLQPLTAQQFQQIMAVPERRAHWVDDDVQIKLPILLTLDTPTVQDDGVDVLTISIDVQDASYAGAVTLYVTAPDGALVPTILNCTAGQVSEPTTTLQTGTHRVRVHSELHGQAVTTFEGV